MNETSKVKVVFLDIGGVIFKIDWLPVLESVGITEPEKQKKLVAEFQHFLPHHQYERGEMSSDDFLVELRSYFSFTGSEDELQKAWDKILVAPLENVERIFDEFSGKLPIYTLSNTNELHMKHSFDNYNILQKFDGYGMSYELGARKPELDIYLRAMKKAGVENPSECLFIDDLAENVTAATSVGFRAFQSVDSVETTIDIISNNL